MRTPKWPQGFACNLSVDHSRNAYHSYHKWSFTFQSDNAEIPLPLTEIEFLEEMAFLDGNCFIEEKTKSSCQISEIPSD